MKKNSLIFILIFGLIQINLYAQNKEFRKNSYSIEEAIKNPLEAKILFLNDEKSYNQEINKFINLEKIILYNCAFDFPVETSEYLKNLEEVDITECEYFPSGLQNLMALKFIDLRSYYPSKIEKEKIENLNLNKFKISNYDSLEIAPENWHLINFDTLEIVFFNNLSIFKDLYKNTQVSHIRILYARKISIIPNFFFLPPNLKSIDIEGCVIDIVEIKKKHNLDKLFINECEIKSIPLKKLKNIKAVQIRNTKIDNVSPEDLDKFENIEVIIEKPKTYKKKKL